MFGWALGLLHGLQVPTATHHKDPLCAHLQRHTVSLALVSSCVPAVSPQVNQFYCALNKHFHLQILVFALKGSPRIISM